jgi:uncharacterized membrane protein
MRCLLVTCGLVILLISVGPRAQLATSFQPLGLGPAGVVSVESNAHDASADGSVVVGEYWELVDPFFIRQGFRWQASTGMLDIGALNPDAPEVQPLAVSNDGSRIVGWSRATSGFIRPFVWTAAGGMQELIEVPGSDAIATDISADGLTIVGHFFDNAPEQAFLWRAGVVTLLGTLPGETDSFALAVCGNGNAVVGTTRSVGGRAFRWTAASGIEELPPLIAGAPTSANACTNDAAIAVGFSGNRKGMPPVRWDAKGPRSLGTLGGDSGSAEAISASGAVVAGSSGLRFVNGVSETTAFRWTAATRKIAQLSRVLEDGGVSTPFCHDAPSTCAAGAWFLRFASGISADGNVIVGTALNPNSNHEAFRAIVP